MVILTFFIVLTVCVSGVKAQNLKSPLLFNAPKAHSDESSGSCEAVADRETKDHIILSNSDNYYLTVNQLAKRIAKNKLTDRERVDSIFSWIVHYVDYDKEAFLREIPSADDPQEVINDRKAVCTGFSNLFAVICKLNNVESRVISGYAKGAGCRDGIRFELPNHAWNAVKIEGIWYLVDVSWASAYRMYLQEHHPETAGKVFPITIYRAFYLADPEAFVMDHLPEDPVWQLLENPVSLSSFERGKEFIQKEIENGPKAFDYKEEIWRTEQLDSIDASIRSLERSIENQYNQYREYNLGIAYYYKACRLMESIQHLSVRANNCTIRQANNLFKKSLSLLSGLTADEPDYHFAVLLTNNIKTRIQ